MTQSIKEITKFTPELFAESLIEVLMQASFEKVDGTLCIIEEVHHNEAQNIITVTLSDESTFHIKVK